MEHITELFEKEVAAKIKAKTILKDKLSESRYGFNTGVDYLEKIFEELERHMPSLRSELHMGTCPNKSIGHYIFVVNESRLVIQLWGRYDQNGSERAGFDRQDQKFTLLYKSFYWKGGKEFEENLVKELVNKLDVVQMV